MSRELRGRFVDGVVVLSLLALLGACATRAAILERPPLPGRVEARPGTPGLVVAAPHGVSDRETGAMAAEIARRTGFALAVATGSNVAPDDGRRPARRHHVNRPLEGVAGGPASEEVATPEARLVYEAYERRVREVAGGPLRFYVELHGNSRRETADRIEIATVGVSVEDAIRLRTLFELVRDAHLRGRQDAPRLTVRVEPADPIVFSASGAKRAGVLRLPERALHVELPLVARREARDVYVLILADFLRQAVALPQPARR